MPVVGFSDCPINKRRGVIARERRLFQWFTQIPITGNLASVKHSQLDRGSHCHLFLVDYSGLLILLICILWLLCVIVSCFEVGRLSSNCERSSQGVRQAINGYHMQAWIIYQVCKTWYISSFAKGTCYLRFFRLIMGQCSCTSLFNVYIAAHCAL